MARETTGRGTTRALAVRALGVVLLALALVWVPGAALARFDAARTASQSVSTATMVAPTQVAGGYQCVGNTFNRGVNLSVTGFTDAGPVGARYVFELVRNGSVVDRVESAQRSAVLDTRIGTSLSALTWTVRVTTRIGGWTASWTSAPVTCGWLSSSTGSLTGG